MAEEKNEIKRINVELPRELHKKIRVRAAVADVSIKNYVIDLITKAFEAENK